MIYLNNSPVHLYKELIQMGKKMIKITRQEAENIFQNYITVRSEVKKDSDGLKVSLYLSNKKQLQINYNSRNMKKSYFIEN